MSRMDCMRWRRGRLIGLSLSLGVASGLGVAAGGPSAGFSLHAQTLRAGGPSLEVTSALGRKLYALPDDESVTTARAKLAADPKNVALVLALSRAEAGRRQYKEAVATCTKGLLAAPDNADLYVERGHRELGLRQFRQAKQDLERATKLAPGNLDAHYHLGLAHYFVGEFREAAASFDAARALAKNDDSLIDCSNWLYVSLRRASDEAQASNALSRITPAVKNTEPHLYFYLRLLHFYQGKIAEKDVLPACSSEGRCGSRAFVQHGELWSGQLAPVPSRDASGGGPF